MHYTFHSWVRPSRHRLCPPAQWPCGSWTWSAQPCVRVTRLSVTFFCLKQVCHTVLLLRLCCHITHYAFKRAICRRLLQLIFFFLFLLILFHSFLPLSILEFYFCFYTNFSFKPQINPNRNTYFIIQRKKIQIILKKERYTVVQLYKRMFCDGHIILVIKVLW